MPRKPPSTPKTTKYATHANVNKRNLIYVRIFTTDNHGTIEFDLLGCSAKNFGTGKML